VEDQAPISNIPPEPPAPESTGEPVAPSNLPTRSKLLFGAVVAIALVVGLYFVNRYWIAPAVRAQSKSSDGSHPMAPDFSLTDIQGHPLKLADFRGKVVVLDFWATWCGPCRIEIPSFVELQKRYDTQGFSMIGISMDDTPDPVVDFYKELQMNYPVAVGDSRMGDLYGGIPGLPTTYVIGRDGRIYAKHVGAMDPGVFESEIKELLAAGPDAEVKTFHQAGQLFDEDKIELGDPAEVDSEVPGIDISKLTTDQKDAYKKKLGSQYCTCGCKRNLLDCRINDRSCATSKKMAKEQLEALLTGKALGGAGSATPAVTPKPDAPPKEIEQPKGKDETNAPPASK
jgi:thiol-disulfide isomerase/thioredoxin